MHSLKQPLEYKYIVRNPDGRILEWTPGENIKLALPSDEEASSGIHEVVVGDAWDGRSQSIQLVGSKDGETEEDDSPEEDKGSVVDDQWSSKEDAPSYGSSEDVERISMQVSECLTSEETEAEIAECLEVAAELTITRPAPVETGMPCILCLCCTPGCSFFPRSCLLYFAALGSCGEAEEGKVLRTYQGA